MTFTAAILGRPNVGKSTLFNRLVGQRLALVDDTPGVTRDRLEARMRGQTEQAVAAADVVLLLVDARAGLTPLDEHFAAWLRRSRKPVRVVANKAEGRAGSAGMME